jgi:hypothetical protein
MLCAIGAGKKVQLLLEEEERFGAFELAQWRGFDGAMAAAEGANVVAGDEGEQVRPHRTACCAATAAVPLVVPGARRRPRAREAG